MLMYMSFNLTLNSSNVVSGSNNTQFKYNLIGGNFAAKDLEMCVGSITMPYSFFNVSSYYQNKTLQYIFPTSTTPITRTLTLADGFYTVTDIDNAIQADMIDAGLYLLDSAGNYVFYLDIAYDTTFYAVRLITYAVPTSLPSGFTNPAGITFPATATTTQLVIPATNSLGTILGYSAGTYPPTALSTNQSRLGNITPVGSTVQSLIMRCNLANNPIGFPSDIVDAFPINTTFGSNITYDPSFEKWVQVRDGTYSNVIITIVDQNFNQIFAQDPNVAITILFRKVR